MQQFQQFAEMYIHLAFQSDLSQMTLTEKYMGYLLESSFSTIYYLHQYLNIIKY